MLTKLLRSVRRSLLYKGRCRKKWIADSTSLPQLHIGLNIIRKSCFNLCSRRWLSPSWIHVIYLIPIGLRQSKNEGWRVVSQIADFLQRKPCFLKVIPGVLGRLINFKITQKFRRPLSLDYLPFLVTMVRYRFIRCRFRGHSQIKNSILNVDPTSRSWYPPPLT